VLRPALLYNPGMDAFITHMTALLGVAMVVAMLARRLHLPYTVGLVVTGIGLAFARLENGANLTHDLIFDLILPPLLFEAALNLRWRDLRADFAPILALSTFGVVISAALVAFGLMRLLDWPIAPAVIFGVLIAATDPIAVIAMFKDTGVEGRLRLLVESESLFNDGVAAVLFGLALAWAQSDAANAGDASGILRAIALVAGGGIALGLACGFAAIRFAGRTSDHLIETTLTVVAAYGSFLLAEHFHFSGVLACVSAGLVMGNLGLLREDDKSALSEGARAFVVEFWEFAASIANSLVFLLIGLRAAAIPFASVGVATLLVANILVLIGRAVTVYPICLIFARSRWRVPLAEQHVLWWGGLRGALALALVLALPQSLPYHDEIVIAAFGVVTFSVIAQGVTMPALLRWLGVTRA
jgi:monovalent cation:H+ antiporter, CPA1 family